jgi:hypothetical protein
VLARLACRDCALILFCMQNRISGPYLAAMHRILISVLCGRNVQLFIRGAEARTLAPGGALLPKSSFAFCVQVTVDKPSAFHIYYATGWSNPVMRMRIVDADGQPEPSVSHVDALRPSCSSHLRSVSRNKTSWSSV